MDSVRYQLTDQQEVAAFRKIEVLQFSIPEYSDAIGVSADLKHMLKEWSDSDRGKFVLEHAIETPQLQSYTRYTDYATRFVVIAELPEYRITEYYLKFDTKF